MQEATQSLYANNGKGVGDERCRLWNVAEEACANVENAQTTKLSSESQVGDSFIEPSRRLAYSCHSKPQFRVKGEALIRAQKCKRNGLAGDRNLDFSHM